MKRIKVKPLDPTRKAGYVILANMLVPGDILRYEGSLIYCERRLSENRWEFSCPWKENFELHRSEIENKLKH